LTKILVEYTVSNQRRTLKILKKTKKEQKENKKTSKTKKQKKEREKNGRCVKDRDGECSSDFLSIWGLDRMYFSEIGTE
jgi:hypothetical protein